MKSTGSGSRILRDRRYLVRLWFLNEQWHGHSLAILFRNGLQLPEDGTIHQQKITRCVNTKT